MGSRQLAALASLVLAVLFLLPPLRLRLLLRRGLDTAATI
jgi:hypothetical protein